MICVTVGCLVRFVGVKYRHNVLLEQVGHHKFHKQNIFPQFSQILITRQFHRMSSSVTIIIERALRLLKKTLYQTFTTAHWFIFGSLWVTVIRQQQQTNKGLRIQFH
jgi:uncharacterized membrane protein YozB (DUF420 family)